MSAGSGPAHEDHVDRILQQWHRERPELDTQGMGILGRIYRLAAAARGAMERTFAEHGITGPDFDVLATLRRNGPPHQLSPGALSDDLLLTSGGMTARLDRLEREGLIERAVDPADRRARLITLTDHGLQDVEAAVDAAVATQQRLVAGLSPDRRRQVDDLLRDLLAALTREAAPFRDLPPAGPQRDRRVTPSRHGPDHDAQPDRHPPPEVHQMGILRPDLPPRSGPPPQTVGPRPHAQTTQNPPVGLQEALARRVLALTSVSEGESQVSVAGSRAFLLDGPAAGGPPAAFQAGREFAHIHPPEDGSLHMTLPYDIAEQAYAAHWGEPHPVSGTPLIYGPRDEAELEVVWRLLQASYDYASATPTTP